MSPGQAKTFVLAGIGVGAGLACVGPLQAGHAPPLRVPVGAAVAGIVLLAVADVAPSVAAGLAAVVLIGSLLTHGIAAARSVQTALGQ